MSVDPTAFPKVLTLYLKLSQYPILASRIRERMRAELFERGVITPEAFQKELKAKAIESQIREGLGDQLGKEPDDIWSQRRAIIRDNLTDFYFAYNLPHDLFEDIMRQVLAERVPHQDVILTFHPELAPWDMLFAQGESYESLPPEQRAKVEHNLEQIKVVLIKTMISDHLDYIGIAKEWFNIADLKEIRARRFGRGKIGGKAAGLKLAEMILKKSADKDVRKFVQTPRSWFIGADVFYDFNHYNDLLDFANQKYRSEEEIRSNYPAICQAFARGRFPEDVIEGLRTILEAVGSQPLIVRSSSLLEDSFGTSFAGKYESQFCPNQSSSQSENLRNLVTAIQTVYATVYSPEVILYRRKMRLIDYDERMAILIQVVQGERRGRYFMPFCAGVAFSRNQYRWSSRIDRKAGFVRLVWGLGTRAVDQQDGDYPRLVALSHPELRPETDPKYIQAYSQRFVDVIDLESNKLRTLPIEDVVGSTREELPMIGQRMRGGHLEDIIGRVVDINAQEVVLTFSGLLRRTAFARLMRSTLETLEKAYRVPVDTEFTLELELDKNRRLTPQLNMVQCRPLSRIEREAATLPTDIPLERTIFTSKRMVPDGRISGVRYVVFVTPSGFREMGRMGQQPELAQLVGRINKRLEDEVFILIGPGRWGSNNPELGIPVTYSHIYNARALVELTTDRMKAEPSYGTHFFQDLVESEIFPLAVALNDPGATFDTAYFEAATNVLPTLLPGDAGMAPLVKIVDVPASSDGAMLELVMDGDAGAALAYLVPTEDQQS